MFSKESFHYALVSIKEATEKAQHDLMKTAHLFLMVSLCKGVCFIRVT